MEYSNKAVVVKGFGSYDCLSIEKFSLPSLEGKLEVQVKMCGMNFADLYTRQGLMLDHKVPFVLGIECVGIIKRIGLSENNSFKVGQRVICYNHYGGLHQDIIRITPNHCYVLPDDVSDEDGAALLVNYLTAYFALFDLGGLKPNATILIQSCAGGVGCAATQLAKTIPNVKVIGTTSKNKENSVKENGVDVVINYDNFEETIKNVCPDGFDLIIENQAGRAFGFLQNSLRQFGRIILTGANSIIQNDKKLSTISLLKAWWNMKDISPLSLIMNNRSVSGLHLGVLAEKDPLKLKSTLDTLFCLLKDGKIKPKIDSIWPIEDVVFATKKLGERRNIGKVLLSI